MHGLKTISHWVEQCRHELQSHQGSIILLDDGRWGSQVVCRTLVTEGQVLVWLELDAEELADPQVRKARLAAEVNSAVGRPVLSEARDLHDMVVQLKSLSPMTLVLTAADHAPDFAQTLLTLQSEQCQVIVHFHEANAEFYLPDNARVLGEHFFRLSQEQAQALAPELTADALSHIYAESEGAYSTFMTLLDVRRENTVANPPSEGRQADDQERYQLLMEQERYFEALDLVVNHCPQEVSALLRDQSRLFWAQAEPKHVFGLLKKVPREYRDVRLVTWHLAMALQIGKETELVEEVEDLLAQQPDPELRAFYAATKLRSGDPEGHLFQAEKAVMDKKTVITMVHYGSALMLTDPEKGVEVLEDALRLAETQKHFYWASLCALKLSAHFTMMGKYAYAKDYAQWGLKLQRARINNTALHLRLINEWAFVSMLSDDNVTLEAVFEDELKELEAVLPEIRQLFKGTLADYYLSQQQQDKACQIYQELWLNNVRRENYGVLALHYVRSLIELERFTEALEVAEEAVRLTRNVSIKFRRDAKLAHGMALAMLSPKKAVSTLNASLHDFSNPYVAYRKARAVLYLAFAHLQNGDRRQAQEALLSASDCLDELTKRGLIYMAGPEVLMAATFALLERSTEARPLEIYALREPMVVYQGRLLTVRPRQLEILVVLALHPEGMTGEQLTLAVYGEATNVSVCKNEINRLRKVGLPIDSRPYRLALPLWADFVEIVELLEERKIAEAVDVYQQPLLITSESPTVVEQRELLEEMLRQVVIDADDKDALHSLATRLKSDLVLWEAVEAQLPEGDSRRPLAQAYREQLKNDWFN